MRSPWCNGAQNAVRGVSRGSSFPLNASPLGLGMCVAHYPPGFGMGGLNSPVTVFARCLQVQSVWVRLSVRDVPFQAHKAWNSVLTLVSGVPGAPQFSATCFSCPLGWCTLTAVLKSNQTPPKEGFQWEQSAFPAPHGQQCLGHGSSSRYVL